MSIHNHTINSLEDLYQAFNSGPNQSAISEINSSIYNYSFSVQEAIDNHHLGHLFEEAYSKSLGFSTSAKSVKRLESFKELLKLSVNLCRDTVPPLLLQSIKSHQKAFEHFTHGEEKEAAMASIAEAGEVAKKIAKEYKKLEQEFSTLREEAVEDLCSLLKDEQPLYAKKREIESDPTQKNNTITLTPLLDKGIHRLGLAIKCYGKITVALLNLSYFWGGVQSQLKKLEDPDLANPGRVQFRELRSDKRKDPFHQMFVEAAKALDAIDPPQKKAKLSEVASSMRTGVQAPLTEPSHPSDFLKMIIKPLPGIEEEYESSYINWLAIAKVNHLMSVASEEALQEVEENQAHILHSEQDTLVVALNTLVC